MVVYSDHSKVIGVIIGYIVIHLISIGYLAFYLKIGSTYHLKTARLVILVPQLVYLMLTRTILDNIDGDQYTMEIISLMLGMGHGMSFAIIIAVLIADFFADCFFQTEGVNTKDIKV